MPRLLDPRNVPESAARLLPLAEKWAIGDDFEREEAVSRATGKELQSLVSAVDTTDDEFWDWLAGPASYEPNPSPEYLALTALTMAADSARLKLRGRC
jgi:hypothetical protein